MEIFELRYFLAVAQNENVHRASEGLNVSPGSLSKTISRLEDELGISLFYKQGRNIRLTPEGLALKKRAALIVQLEEDAKIELSGQKGTLNVVISAEEILHTHFGISLSESIHKAFTHSRFQFLTRTEAKVIQQVEDGEAHFGILTGEVPQGLKSKTLSKVEFKTCASAKHPLFKKFSQASKIPVEEVLKFPFASPESAMLGKISTSASLDGWRDDKFPRQIRYRASGLKIMEKLLQRGHALAYLPDYYVKELDLVYLSVTGCPYSCQQSVKLICRDPDALGWMSKIWDSI
ncbi:MAG: LysR family transcriptional regulator [Bdellovibrionaceae bacterium]|nr:LysR family transcriptional regulator [Pseudobdellovibrionaceae bacterium]